MRHLKRKTLAVIGAGPKGIAVAVKAKVLEEFGIKVDRVILIEKHGIAANWSGDFGYTNGEMKLGTSPEKDVVFPIETDVGDPMLNTQIRQRLLQFTWTAFLVQTNRYADWVDRGRPAPNHQLWATYLQWVCKQLAPQITILTAEVTHVDLTENGNAWQLSLRNSTNLPCLSSLSVDRLMLTGPGKTQCAFMQQTMTALPSTVYDLESFWHALKTKKLLTTGKLAIVGAGENAAAALLALAQYAPQLQIDVISPKGFITTRAENYYENSVYSQPDHHGWSELTLSDRIDFIERTDIGVISHHAMSILNEQVRHQIIAGRVINLQQAGNLLSLTLQYRQQVTTHKYDQVILATGFDQVTALQALLTSNALKTIEKTLNGPLCQRRIATHIQADLSIKNLSATLHLPMLAGLMQGPGFANLSCLGLLSDRVTIQANLLQIRDTNLAYKKSVTHLTEAYL